MDAHQLTPAEDATPGDGGDQGRRPALPRRRDWSSLEDRHATAQAARMAALAVLALAAVLAPLDVSDADRRRAVLACGGALVLHLLLRELPARRPAVLRTAADVALVVDAGLVVALALVSGGGASPALWLLPLVALTCALTLSARSGIKAAVLALIAIAAVHALSGDDVEALRSQAGLVLFLAAVVAVAAPLTHVNQRELRLRGDRMRLLHDAAKRMQTIDDRGELMRVAGEVARELVPGWDARVRPAEHGPATALRREEGRVVLEVPVTARDHDERAERIVAVVAGVRVAPRRRVRLRASRLEAVEALATSLGAALTRVALTERLARLSMSDALTGLANRRAFDAALQAELARARRGGTPLALALLDVDHFKRFNDTHGHQAGDAALVAVAGALDGAARAEDHACRFGGEEFALLLPGAGRPAAEAVAERVRRAVRAADTGHAPVTVSVGVAVYGGDGAPPDLVAAADACLYAAKEAGRDRVVVAPEADGAPAPAPAAAG